MELIPYIVIGLIVFFLWLQLRVVFAAKRRQGQPAPDVPAARGPGNRLFYFYSEHCGPCRSMQPLIDRIAAEDDRLVKVDVTREPELTRDFGISATPALVRVVNGTIDKVVLGTVTEKRLAELLR